MGPREEKWIPDAVEDFSETPSFDRGKPRTRRREKRRKRFPGKKRWTAYTVLEAVECLEGIQQDRGDLRVVYIKGWPRPIGYLPRILEVRGEAVCELSGKEDQNLRVSEILDALRQILRDFGDFPIRGNMWMMEHRARIDLERTSTNEEVIHIW